MFLEQTRAKMKSIMITNAEKMAPAVTQLASDATQIELPHTRKWSGRWEAAIPYKLRNTSWSVRLNFGNVVPIWIRINLNEFQ